MNSQASTRYARHIGRVGALAVALGVGVALATSPGVAFADPADGGGAQSQGEGEAAVGSNPQGTAPAATDPPATSDPDDAAADDGAAAVEQPGSSVTTTIGGGDGPTVVISSSGGAHTSGTVENEPESTSDIAPPEDETPTLSVEPTTIDPPVAPSGDTVTAPAEEVAQAGAAVPAVEPGEHYSNSTVPADETIRKPLQAAHAAADPEDGIDAVSTVESHPEPSRAQVQRNAMTLDAPQPAPPAPLSPIEAFIAIPVAVFAFASNLVNTALTAFLIPNPATPTEPPLLWALVAWVRRQFEQTYFNGTPSLNPSPPVQAASGQIHGSFGGTDPDGDALVYSVPTSGAGAPAGGTVAIDQASGTWTYTPREGFSGSDTFTVTVTDATTGHVHGLFSGNGGHTASADITVVVVPSSRTPEILGAPVESGGEWVTVHTTRSGTRAYVSAYSYDDDSETHTGRVTLIDTATGQVVGSPIETGGYGQAYFSADGTRAYEVTQRVQRDGDTREYDTDVTVIDTGTGAVLGTAPITSAGYATDFRFSDDGSYAYLTTLDEAPDGTSHVTITKIATAAATATSSDTVVVSLPGQRRYSHEISEHGDILLVTAVYYRNVSTGGGYQYAYTTTVSVYDKSTAAFTVEADQYGSFAAIEENEAQGYVYVLGYNEQRYATSTTEVALIDTETGLIRGGSSFDVDGLPVYYRSLQTNNAGSLAYLTLHDDDRSTIAVIDVTTGRLAGDPLVLQGRAGGQDLLFTPDGERAYAVTTESAYDQGQTVSTTRLYTVDPDTGILLGNPLILAGGTESGSYGYAGPMRINEAGTLLYVTTTHQADGLDRYTDSSTTITVVDAEDGHVVRTVELDGYNNSGDLEFSPNGEHVSLAVQVYERVNGTLNYLGQRRITLDANTGAVISGPTDLPSGTTYQLTPDGTRAIRSTYDGNWGRTVTFIDPATGQAVGPSAQVPVSYEHFSADGTTVVFAGYANTTTGTTEYAVFDVATGRQIGTTITVPSTRYSGPTDPGGGGGPGEDPDAPRLVSNTFTADGTRYVSIVNTRNDEGRIENTAVVVIDLSTGELLGGESIVVEGAAGGMQVVGDGSRVLVLANRYDETTYRAIDTRLAVIDTGTGLVLSGEPTVIPGALASSNRIQPVVSSDGERGYVTVETVDAGGSVTSVYTIDLTDGSFVGDPISISGRPAGGVAVSSDGTRAYQTTVENGQASVTVIDTGRSAVRV